MKFLICAAFLFLSSTPAYSQNFLAKCPCGPDAIKGPFRLIFTQGIKGADFRTPCEKHDACYEMLKSTKKRCDNAFRTHLLTECHKNSTNLKKCRKKARFMYWLVNKFGAVAYRKSVRI